MMMTMILDKEAEISMFRTSGVMPGLDINERHCQTSYLLNAPSNSPVQTRQENLNRDPNHPIPKNASATTLCHPTAKPPPPPPPPPPAKSKQK